MQRRAMLSSLLFAPLALVGLARPRKRQSVADLQVKITCDTSQAEEAIKRLQDGCGQLKGVHVHRGDLAFDVQNPGTVSLG
jgi:hypothetical protein